MIKPLSILSISAVTLLATTQAHSHVICAPNNPNFSQAHTHNQSYTVPRIQQVSQQSSQKHLQAQRARQQKALANQQRINRQRRAQALAKQQQDKARKAVLIQQQRAAALRAQAARQKAALAAAKRVRTQQRQVTTKPVHYAQPAYVQQPTYHAPAPTRVYRPANNYVSVQISTGSNHRGQRAHQHHHRIKQSHIRYVPQHNVRAYTYKSGGHKVARHHKHGQSRKHSGHGKVLYINHHR